MNQEIEIKYRVANQKALDALEACARGIFPRARPKEVHQTNFFFDTNELKVRKKGLGVRLRQQDKKYILTLKGPHGDKKSKPSKVTQRLEFEVELKKKQALELLSGEHDIIWVVEHLDGIDAKMTKTRDHLLSLVKEVCAKKELMLIGSFTNIRRILPIVVDGHKMKLEFDRTLFTNKPVHYEVELEIPSMAWLDSAEAFLSNLFSQCGEEPAYEKSKSERFYSFLERRAP